MEYSQYKIADIATQVLTTLSIYLIIPIVFLCGAITLALFIFTIIAELVPSTTTFLFELMLILCITELYSITSLIIIAIINAVISYAFTSEKTICDESLYSTHITISLIIWLILAIFINVVILYWFQPTILSWSASLLVALGDGAINAMLIKLFFKLFFVSIEIIGELLGGEE